MNTLVLGVGTGRCGTKSLVRLLEYQESTKVTHERYGPKVRWNCPPYLWPMRLWKNSLRVDSKFVSDVSFYWTLHIETFLKWGEEKGRDVRVVGLKRDREGTIDSYDRWKPNSDHWSFHGYRETLPDQWDHCYPCYDTGDKREGIGLFWDEVYDIIESFEDDRVKCFRTEDLNNEEGVRKILEHVGYENPVIEPEIKIKAPNINDARNSTQW